MSAEIPEIDARQKNGRFRANLLGSLERTGPPVHRWAVRTMWLGFCLLALLTAGCAGTPTTFHPSQAIPPASVSHTGWDRLLHRHVADGVVNYPALARDKEFGEYLNLLNHVDPSALPTKEARLAFWVNAYNAFAAKGIVDGYSPKSLWGKYRFFIGAEYSVGGVLLNLYDLEHDILIPTFQEPRIHFAIVCASSSCPKLQSWAYQAAELDQQLDHAARAFINDPLRNRFDREKRVAHLSMIFNWFMQDFVDHAGSLIQYVKPYVEDPELVKELEMMPYRVEFLEYDWSLNGLPMPEDR